MPRAVYQHAEENALSLADCVLGYDPGFAFDASVPVSGPCTIATQCSRHIQDGEIGFSEVLSGGSQ